MSIPARPSQALHEGPAESCVINGINCGWLNCTPTSFAMGLDKATLGRTRLVGCDIRRLTGDVIGGTNLSQCAAVLKVEYGMAVEVRTGSSVCSPGYGAVQLHSGRAIVLQGNAGVLVGTAFRSTGGNVNHCIYVNEGRGWKSDGTPTEVLVYDPAADGRLAGWGRAATSPQWWPWALLVKFAAALRPWGDDDARVLGPGKWYAGIFPDTEPHCHLRFAGSVHAIPFPRQLTVHSPTVGRLVNVRSGPSRNYAVVRRLKTGAGFTAYQQNPSGQSVSGSRLWYGDHSGTLWIHSSGVR